MSEVTLREACFSERSADVGFVADRGRQVPDPTAGMVFAQERLRARSKDLWLGHPRLEQYIPHAREAIVRAGGIGVGPKPAVGTCAGPEGAALRSRAPRRKVPLPELGVTHGLESRRVRTSRSWRAWAQASCIARTSATGALGTTTSGLASPESKRDASGSASPRAPRRARAR